MTASYGFAGKTHTKESKRKIGDANRGRPGSMRGRKHSPEAKEKMSKAQLGKKRGPRSPEVQERVTAAVRAAMTPEVRAKISTAKSSTLPLTYFSLHAKLRRERGSASEYMCRCGRRAEEWALQWEGEETVSQNLDDYEPMCIRCHRALDYRRHACVLA